MHTKTHNTAQDHSNFLQARRPRRLETHQPWPLYKPLKLETEAARSDSRAMQGPRLHLAVPRKHDDPSLRAPAGRQTTFPSDGATTETHHSEAPGVFVGGLTCFTSFWTEAEKWS